MTDKPVRKVKITVRFETQDVAPIPNLFTVDATPGELLVRVATHASRYMSATKYARWWQVDWAPGTRKGQIISTKASDKRKTLVPFDVVKGWK
ncbi:hypothetical protein SEA_EASTWEST_62 [Arthrobacter phage EastWest]|uniref:Uncharacterized protein n=1 Tax=Arthrobacter phage EastWest TaxID=2894292 RepID=A0AAE8YLN7_9CAUD|nr:hypothetical protein SEA_EASTWEST_62 [Arthrobacter phage EastWest]